MFSRFLLIVVIFVIGSAAALADAKEDCEKLEGDVAIRACDQAILQNPKDHVSFHNRGILYRANRDLDRAIANYTTAIEISGGYAGVYNDRAVAYRLKGDLDRAIADYNKAIEIDPKYVQAYNNRATVYFHKRQFESGMADLAKALELEPKRSNTYNNRCAARIVFNRDLPLALLDCDTAANLNPKSAAV